MMDLVSSVCHTVSWDSSCHSDFHVKLSEIFSKQQYDYVPA